MKTFLYDTCDKEATAPPVTTNHTEEITFDEFMRIDNRVAMVIDCEVVKKKR